VRYSDVFVGFLYIFGHFVNIADMFRVQVNATRLPAQIGIVFIWLPEAGEHKPLEQVVEGSRPWSVTQIRGGECEALACQRGRARPMNFKPA
jgi:hypothetical protein